MEIISLTEECVLPALMECTLTVKLGLDGAILSSASTLMPLLSLRDWYSMSWPSTLRLAMVKMLLFRSFCDTVSEQTKTQLRQVNLPSMS